MAAAQASAAAAATSETAAAASATAAATSASEAAASAEEALTNKRGTQSAAARATTARDEAYEARDAAEAAADRAEAAAASITGTQSAKVAAAAVYSADSAENTTVQYAEFSGQTDTPAHRTAAYDFTPENLIRWEAQLQGGGKQYCLPYGVPGTGTWAACSVDESGLTLHCSEGLQGSDYRWQARIYYV